MSLNNILLSSVVIQSLFKNSLIDLNVRNIALEPDSTKSVFLGNNKKNVLIIVKNAQSVYLPDDELSFLMNILAACNLTIADITLLNLSNSAFTYLTIIQQFNSKKIILFGVEPAELQIPIALSNYQIQQYNNHVYLSAPSLSVLQSDKSEKVKLWSCLKQIFLNT